MAVQESAPMGAEQGGVLLDWFKKLFARKPNPEDMVSLTSLPEDDTLKGKGIREILSIGSQVKEGPRMINPKRADLREVLENRYANTEYQKLMENEQVQNASGTVKITGLSYNRMIGPLMKSAGGDASTEEMVGMFDHLLSAGQAGQGGLSQEEIQDRDAKFDTGFRQLKQTYLAQLRRMKEKYGTYPTQMHPEDFIRKVGVDYFDDAAIVQDTEQMMRSGERYFDYTNPDDAEFKLLSDYYGDSYTQLFLYTAADPSAPSAAFNPTEEGLDYVERRGKLDKLMASEQQLRKNNKDIKGFTNRQMNGYLRRLRKRFDSDDLKKRLIGRFRK